MWETLHARLDSATTLIGRTGIFRKFRAACPPINGQIDAYFARLREYRHQLPSTAVSISEEFRTHIYTTVPDQFKTTIRAFMRQTPTPSVEEVMNAIGEDADTDALTMEIGDTSTGSTLYASSHGRGRGQFLEAVDEAAVLLEDTDMNVDVEGDTTPIPKMHPLPHGQPHHRRMRKGSEIPVVHTKMCPLPYGQPHH